MSDLNQVFQAASIDIVWHDGVHSTMCSHCVCCAFRMKAVVKSCDKNMGHKTLGTH